MPEITFQLLDGTQAASHADELRAVHAEVYAEPPYARTDDGAWFAERLPAALVQGLRDYFGAHTYRRTDRDGVFHTLWAQDRAEVTR